MIMKRTYFKGSLDPTFFREKPAEMNFFWYALTKYMPTFDPREIPKEIEEIQCFSVDFIKNHERWATKNGSTLDFWRAGGFTAGRCLHDPTVMDDVNELKVTS